MNFAKGTTVSVEKTRSEIERTLIRYGATGFASGWRDGKHALTFELMGRQIRFVIVEPDKKEFELTRNKSRRSDMAVLIAHENEVKRRWRSLLLRLKAKLEAVSSGDAIMEEEFIYNFVLPNNQTIGEMLQPQIENILAKGNLPKLLPGLG